MVAAAVGREVTRWCGDAVVLVCSPGGPDPDSDLVVAAGSLPTINILLSVMQRCDLPVPYRRIPSCLHLTGAWWCSGDTWVLVL